MGHNAGLEHFTIRLTISRVGEVCRAFARREIRNAGANDFPQAFDRSRCRAAQHSFEFREELLDRIKVRAVRRKVEQRCAARFYRRADAGNLVHTDIVHDDNVTSPERRGKDLLDIGQKRRAIHRAIQQEGRGHAIVAQRRNKGRGLPMTMRHLADETLASRFPTIAAGHLRGRRSFIDEYELSWIEPGLHLEPRPPRCGYVRPILFGRVQAFF